MNAETYIPPDTNPFSSGNSLPYNSLSSWLKERWGEKIYKLALDGGMSCPGREDGSGGCIFCSQGGSGEFAQKKSGSVFSQIEAAKERVANKMTMGGRYIAYFQSYTNTYAPLPYLEKLFSEAISHPDVAILSVATRPDCLPPDTISLLSELNQTKPVWVELGLQTIHETTAQNIRRGYPLSCFEAAYKSLKAAGLTVIVHVILGLPGESRADILETVNYLGQLHVDGIKLQLLHILEGTELALRYQKIPFPIFSILEYADLVVECISILPPDVVIHRLSGDGPKNLLIAPLWSAQKRLVLNTITRRFAQLRAYQGCRFKDESALFHQW